MESLRFLVEVDTAKGEQNIKRVGTEFDNVGKKGKTAGSDVSAGLDKIGASASKAGAALSSLGTKLSLTVTAPIAAVAALGVSFNAMQEQAQIAFTTMLGSGEKAKAYLDDLKEFAAKTPFEFPDLVRASQRLIAMGFAAKDVKPLLTAVGDAVAGLGGGAAEIDRVTLALGQMQGRGRVATQEMNQLTEVGIPAWRILAESIGISESKLRDLVEKGAVPAGKAVEALVEGMNKSFGGMMEKQATSFNGLISTIKDEARFLAGELTTGLFNAIKGPAASLVETLHNLRGSIDGMSDSTKATILVVAGLAAAVGPLLILFGTMASSVGQMISLYQTLVPLIQSSTVATGALSVAMTALGAVAIAALVYEIVQLVKAYQDLRSAQDNLNQTLATQKTSQDRAIQTLKDHGVAVEALGMSTGKQVVTMGVLGEVMRENMKQGDKWTASINVLADAHTGNAAATEKGKKAQEGWNLSAMEGDKNAKKLAAAIKLAAKESWDASADALKKMKQEGDNSIDYWTRIYEKQLDAKIDALGTIEKALDRNRDAMAKHEKDMLDQTHDTVAYQTKIYQEGQDQVIDFYDAMLKKKEKLDQQAIDDMKRNAGAIFDDLFKKGENVFTNLKTMLKGGVLSLGRSIFEDIVGNLLGPVKKAFDDFFEGLLEGIGLKKFIAGVGNAIGGALSKVLGGGSSAAGAATSVATSTGGAATSVGGAASSAGGIGGAAAGAGASAVVSAVGSVVGAVSGIIGNFQNARLEGTMNAVEANTRFTYIELRDTMDLILQPMKASLENITAELFNHKYLPDIATEILGAIVNLSAPARNTLPPIADGSSVPAGGNQAVNVTVNVYQNPGEDGEAYALRTAELLSRLVERGGGRLIASGLAR